MTTISSPKANIDTALVRAYKKSLIKDLDTWVNAITEQTQANEVYWCDGSKEEYDRLCNLLVEKETFIRLNKKRGLTVLPALATPAMLPALKTKPLYAAEEKKTQAPPTTGWSRQR
jgi:phosphoenolpyruvate carboxykinase (GTP)